jgi:glycosyltransferase involved in cell wall biosynthesis
MQAAVPVVATNSGGTPEILRDGVEGFLYPPGDVASLARKLEILVESPGLRAEMGHRGQKRAREEFSRAHMVEATESLYRRLLAERFSAPAAG